MLLDLRTIYVVGAMTTLLLGSMQIIAYASGRFERWPLWWGLSNLLFGLGVIMASFRGHVSDELSIVLANVLMLAANLLLFASLRQFAGKSVSPLPYAVVLLATAAALAFWIDAANFSLRVALMSYLFACCDLLVGRESVRLVREQRLTTGWLLAGLFIPSAVFWLVRGTAGLAGAMGTELFPPSGARDQWFSVAAVTLLIIRSSALFLLATERSRSQFVALAREDALTGAMNPTGLAAAVAELMLATRPGVPRQDSLLMLDIDHFRALNDQHGHATGDRVLRLLTQVAQCQLRPNDLIARKGGDEFTVLLPGTGSREAIQIAERIRAAFVAGLAELDLQATITLSVGVAAGDLGREPIDSLIQDADDALGRAKRTGRDRIETAAMGAPA